jgi:hypothetical protein
MTDAVSTAARGRQLVAERLRGLGGRVDEVFLPVRSHRLRVRGTPNGKPLLVAVRSRTSGTWQTQASLGTPAPASPSAGAFWVLVDLGTDPVEFYVVPEWWMLDDIHTVHQRYLASHGGTRAHNAASDHHAIGTARVYQWRDRWDLLGL